MNGDVYLTRNTDEVGNTSPGYWNHVAIESDGNIIEAQEIPNAVILVTKQSFRLRYPEFIVLRHQDEKIAQEASERAKTLIGEPYRKYPSILAKNKGFNCVNVVGYAYNTLTWQIPDSIWNGKFVVVEHHKDYKNWIKPDDWFSGRLDIKVI